MTNGNGKNPEVVGVSPVPFSVRVEKDGKAQMPDGQIVDRVRLIVFDPTGSKVVFMPAPMAIQIADLIRTQAMGLTIAPDLRSIEGGQK